MSSHEVTVLARLLYHHISTRKHTVYVSRTELQIDNPHARDINADDLHQHDIQQLLTVPQVAMK